jgi:hypothetical protein
MEQEQTKMNDVWRKEITEQKDILKINDGESVVGVFASEGTKRSHVDYGNSIVFQFLKDKETEPKQFFVKANNYSLLSQIKALGVLTGTKVKISRKGSKRSDTRYTVEKL